MQGKNSVMRKENETMFELIIALFIIVTVFVIFGRDEEGTTRFERRKMKQLQNASGTQACVLSYLQNEQNRAS